MHSVERRRLRTALVHDWLTGMRGGEKVLEELVRLFPEAPIYTLLHQAGSTSELIESRSIRTSFIQRLPHGHYRWYLPLFPRAVESLALADYELVISSSHCVAKGAQRGDSALHVCYCHTPMRYAWDQFDAYFSRERLGPLRYALIRSIARRLRHWDRATASRVDAFAANSRYVAGRIRRYYGREAEVIPPPVDVDRFTPRFGPADSRDSNHSGESDRQEHESGYYLVVSALSPYKRVDVAIDAFNRSARRLVVVGWGPERDRLAALAGPTVRLAGRVDDAELLELYRGCRGLILPGIEDAGIAPLEAMACGRPAIVLQDGGAAEAIEDGRTGVLIRDCTPAAINQAVDTAEKLSFNTREIRQHAEGYSTSVFASRFQAFVERALEERASRQQEEA